MNKNIIGYNNLVVPTTFGKKHDHNDKIAMTLPGYRYSTDAPLLYFAKDLFSQFGFDILSLDHAYNANASYQEKNKEERSAWLFADTMSVYDRIVSSDQYSEIVLYGKSLGTIAILNILENANVEKVSKIIWMTPAVSIERIARTLIDIDCVSRFYVGSGDNLFNKEHYELLENMRDVKVKIVEDAKHSLKIENDTAKSIDILRDIMADITELIEKNE